jgi:hypothetical protein
MFFKPSVRLAAIEREPTMRILPVEHRNYLIRDAQLLYTLKGKPCQTFIAEYLHVKRYRGSQHLGVCKIEEKG